MRQSSTFQENTTIPIPDHLKTTNFRSKLKIPNETIMDMGNQQKGKTWKVSPSRKIGKNKELGMNSSGEEKSYLKVREKWDKPG